MPATWLVDATWTELAESELGRAVAILPVGAVEAHGPHLPLSTDRIIAEAMAEEAAVRLTAEGLEAIILPALDFTAAPFAAEFPGTVSLRPETVVAVLVDVAASVADWGVGLLALANAHLDPAHLGSLRRAAEEIAARGRCRVAFPDVTRRPWGGRLTEEFRSGACHAGRYEGSVVLARRPDLVREEAMSRLPANPRSLATAIGEGRRTFRDAGGELAYFGDPAAATAEEGRRTIEVLGGILAEAVLAEWVEG